MTTTLMTYAGTTEPTAFVTRTGGVPLAPAGTSWPQCSTCDGPMQFLAQVLLDDLGRHAGQGAVEGRDVLALFMCQNDPGMCEEWDPQAGGNRALLFPTAALQPIPVPVLDEDDDQEPVLLGAVSAVAYETASTTADYGQAYTEWARQPGRTPLDALGQLGGQPAWLQNDETPACPTCTREMRLVVQLEEGRDHATAMNFGGRGEAYAFACEPCTQAVFLWQC
ncbi:YwqG family protein [Streptomyces sp. 1331.2]|uniref:YwqG family protein n=1 Tax=Streptomyces sp. 1331.2 TaxID=1938835 RepID=UPI00211BEA5E|nr:YwqG family protein [Streptomyces sp. 1331.2]